jgi:RNA polymerase sigma-70 factor (ECF subfamily)
VTADEPCAGEALLCRAQASDMAAFAELVRTHQRSVYSLALRMLCNRQAAEDLAQEVFLQLHRKLSSVQSDAHLTFWLRKVTLNRAIDRLRREPRYEAVSLDEADTLASEVDDPDPLLQRRLAMLVGQLPPAARAVILLRYQEDMDPMAIARALGMSINTVKSHLKRSLALLRERMAEAGDALADGHAATGKGIFKRNGSLA